jgi:hypothetical protein
MSAETTGLKQAANIYRNICNRARLQSHATRYAFSEERIQAYRSEGYSAREARVATSGDLGHGDGRGRYVASVYARKGLGRGAVRRARGKELDRIFGPGSQRLLQ